MLGALLIKINTIMKYLFITVFLIIILSGISNIISTETQSKIKADIVSITSLNATTIETITVKPYQAPELTGINTEIDNYKNTYVMIFVGIIAFFMGVILL
ncbi:hypothetical protein ACFLZV_02015 [Candidatus Margulisiibacteriota bacterium]